MANYTIEMLGDRALVLYFRQKIDLSIHHQVMSVVQQLETKPLSKQTSIIPAYASLTILFSQSLSAAELKKIKKTLAGLRTKKIKSSEMKTTLVELPVSYGGANGPDLVEVARVHGLSENEVIAQHSKPTYDVYQIGFTPGFPYLGGLPESLRTPRHKTPRLKVSAGSVGIGDAQTGVYTVDGPGGWQIIGKIEIPLFDPNKNPPALLRAGMKVKFKPKQIDLNADVGESYHEAKVGNDEGLIPLVNTVNIACGFHGGDPETMKRAIKLALEHRVQIGAHPSFQDLKNFGRVELIVKPALLEKQIREQLSTLSKELKKQKATIHHVKLHGALYHHVNHNPASTRVILKAIKSLCPEAKIVGLPHSPFLIAAEKLGFSTVREAFVDRRYRKDGSLVPRNEKRAIIDDPQECAEQARSIAVEQQVKTIDGKVIPLIADTLCIHGDHPQSKEIAIAIRKELENAHYQLASFL